MVCAQQGISLFIDGGKGTKCSVDIDIALIVVFVISDGHRMWDQLENFKDSTGRRVSSSARDTPSTDAGSVICSTKKLHDNFVAGTS